jgi:protein AaeX
LIAEFDIYGIFVPALAIFAIIAFLLAFIVRSFLDIIGFYHLVWHRPLFDLCIFVILFGAVTVAAEPVIGELRRLIPEVVL